MISLRSLTPFVLIGGIVGGGAAEAQTRDARELATDLLTQALEKNKVRDIRFGEVTEEGDVVAISGLTGTLEDGGQVTAAAISAAGLESAQPGRLSAERVTFDDITFERDGRSAELDGVELNGLRVIAQEGDAPTRIFYDSATAGPFTLMRKGRPMVTIDRANVTLDDWNEETGLVGDMQISFAGSAPVRPRAVRNPRLAEQLQELGWEEVAFEVEAQASLDRETGEIVTDISATSPQLGAIDLDGRVIGWTDQASQALAALVAARETGAEEKPAVNQLTAQARDLRLAGLEVTLADLDWVRALIEARAEKAGASYEDFVAQMAEQLRNSIGIPISPAIVQEVAEALEAFARGPEGQIRITLAPEAPIQLMGELPIMLMLPMPEVPAQLGLSVTTTQN